MPNNYNKRPKRNGLSIFFLLLALYISYLLMKLSFKMIGLAFSIVKGFFTFSIYFIAIMAIVYFIRSKTRKR